MLLCSCTEQRAEDEGAGQMAKSDFYQAPIDAEIISAAEMMAELDAIAANLNITWTGAEVVGAVEPQRTRYARPGQLCGNGVVRKLSDKQVRFIKTLMSERDMSKLVRLPGSEDVENMSLRGARDLIERLLACPELPKAKKAVRPATEKMVSYVTSLLSERECSETVDLNNLSFDDARRLIDMLKSAPRKTVKTIEVELVEAGMYLVDGTVYKVQRAMHGSGNLYAKVLNTETGSFSYAPGAIRQIRAEHRMTLDMAKEFGALYGMCCRCGRTLTDETSIEAGIGPYCAGRL